MIRSFGKKFNFSVHVDWRFLPWPSTNSDLHTIVEGFAADIVGMSNNDSLSLSVIGCL